VNDDYQDDVDIRLWSDDDLRFWERLMGDPAMTAYLVGRIPRRRSASVTGLPPP